MKKWIAVLLAAALIVPALADARGGRGPGSGGHRGAYFSSVHYYGGGWGGGWGWRNNWFFPAFVGGMVMYDMSVPRTVYVQPDPLYASPVVAPQAQSWYWCAGANAYYPYVTSCPSGWQAVPASPPPPPAQ